MKALAALFLVFGLMNFSYAKTQEKGIPIFLNNCTNYGPGVSYLYQSCVNSNFISISRVVSGGFFPSCTNYGQEVDYFYTDCINRNFQEAAHALKNSVYLQFCSNYDRTTLDGFFTMCVNQNFQTIARALQQL